MDYAFVRWMAHKKGISVLPMSIFCMDGSKNRIENFIRVSICLPKEFF